MSNGLLMAGNQLEGRLEGALEALTEGVALFDSEDRLVYRNGRFVESYKGLGDLLAPGLPWDMLVDEAMRRGMGEGLGALSAHLDASVGSKIAVEAERPGGRWVRLSLHPTSDDGFVLTETDITIDREAEDLRLSADDLMRGVLDACSSNLMMCRIGDGTILYRNPAWLQLFGQKTKARDLYADPTERSDLLAELLPTGCLDDFETTLLRADGGRFPARVSARIIDYGGEDAIVSSTQDMTQLYAQRDEVVRVNRRLFDAIEALDQGFALFDADDRMLMANALFNKVNAPVADAIAEGVPRQEMVAAARAAGHEPLAVGDVPKGAPARASYEYTLEDGRTFAASRKPTSDGGFVLAWRDVTEARAAARELERQRETTFQSEKLTALGELLAGIAHELNNPLSVVVGQALMLQEDVQDPALTRRIDKISHAAERCAKIVKTFLAMARERPVELAPIDASALVETALDVIGYSLRSGGIEVESDLAEDLPPVRADEDQITQLIINLAVNAQQALAETTAPRVRFSTAPAPSGGTSISVADNGPGVPDKLRQRIFEPFFTTKDVGEGTGVGLALCHRIAVAHGGRLDVGRSPLGGAAFTLTLPATKPAQPAKDVAPSADPVYGLLALVVEDEPEVAGMIAELLGGMGIRARLAASVPQALHVLDTEGRFDLVLSDLRMPGPDGLVLYRQLLRSRPDLAERFAFITGDAMSADAEEIRTRSGRPLLEKPVAPAELRELVGRLTKDAGMPVA